MPTDASGADPKPKKKKAVAASPAPDFFSEHGQGGGDSPSDPGTVETPQPGYGTGGGLPDVPVENGGSSSAPGVTVPTPDNTDYSALLGVYGLPQDIVDRINGYYHSSLNPDGTINYQEAYTLAHAYILGTPWYAATYPGIQQGINAGLFNDESGYRAYQNTVNQVYRQYYGREALPGEISGYITAGKQPGQVANEFQAAAIKGNFSDPLKALFGDTDLTALANQQAGIDSALGQKVAAEASLYTSIAPLYQNFYGRDPTRGELDQLTAAGTSPQTVAQQFATTENINGMNPAVRDIFTPDEIKQVALDAAGGITPNGSALKSLMDLSLQLNPIYHQYTGAGVSRQDVEDAQTGGLTPQTVGEQFQGAAYIAANKGDIQQASGSFGDTGQLSAAELKSLGEETAGLDTPQGQALAAAYNKTLARFHGVFKGVLASPALSLASGRLAGPGATKPPDVAA